MGCVASITSNADTTSKVIVATAGSNTTNNNKTTANPTDSDSKEQASSAANPPATQRDSKPPLKSTHSVEPISVASASQISTNIPSSNTTNMPSTTNSLTGESNSIGIKTSMLHSVPLLSKLTTAEVEQLATLVSDQHYPPHTPIIHEGELGHGFFIIAKGECTVSKKGKKNEVIHIATLKAGDYFGEAALINHAKRGATVASVTPVDVFYLQRDHFTSLFAPDRLNIQFAKRQAVSAEKVQASVAANSAASLASSMSSFTPFAGEKTAETKALILSTIANNILFLNLEPELLDHIVSRMYKKEIKKGTNAIVQGEAGDHLYVVESGSFHVFVNKVKVATREKKSLFGELALMYNSPRAATVTAMQDSVVWVLERSTFRRIVTRSNEKKFNLYLEFLKKVDLLQPLAEYERKKVTEAIDEVSFSANTTVFHQGDEGDAMFIIYSGEVKIVKKEADGTSTEVAYYKKGDSFGERALLTNEARAATAIATAPVHLLRLDRISFHLLLGPLEEILKKRIQGYQSGSTSARSAVSAAVAPLPPLQEREKLAAPIEFKNLQVIGTLGQGSFGYVQLVRDSVSKKCFALKAVNKQQIVKTGQQGHVMSEKNAMLLFQHPFCIQLYATFKDANRLYFLLEPSLGGELFSVLRERTLFDEETARFYAGSVVLAFEYIHSMNYCYRDLKPENLLLGGDGYLKVTDFGFAKEISSGRTWTLCGTPDYLAPEIIAGKGHGKAVDWWTVGVFIYEMLASYPPFYDDDPMKTYARIMRGQVNYPSHFSKNAISIISGFLQAKPTKRLGCLKGSVSEIKSHPWFEGLDWDALIAKKIKAPIIPKIASENDLSNFDDYSKSNPAPIQQYVDDGSNWDADF